MQKNTVSLKLDSKGRVTIGSFFKGWHVSSVKASFDEKNQKVVLEPQVEISLKEMTENERIRKEMEALPSTPVKKAWFYDNKKVMEALHVGLKQSAKGMSKSLGDFTKYIKD